METKYDPESKILRCMARVEGARGGPYYGPDDEVPLAVDMTMVESIIAEKRPEHANPITKLVMKISGVYRASISFDNALMAFSHAHGSIDSVAFDRMIEVAKKVL